MVAAPIILTAETHYRHARARWHHLPAAEWCSYAYPIPEWRLAMIGDLPRKGQHDQTVTTFAYINQGRWLTDCPFCKSTQTAAKTDRRFLCAGHGGCANSTVGGATISVVWPEDADRIEAILVKRPNPDNRNWTPGETVKDLQRENAERLAA